MARRTRKVSRAGLGLAAFLTCLSAPAIAAADASPRPLLLETKVNALALDEPQLFLRTADGGLWASEEMLRRARLHVAGAERIRYDGQSFLRIDRFPGLKAALSEEAQTIALEADANLFEAQKEVIGEEERLAMTAPGRGAFLNYDAFVEHSKGKTSASGAFELNAFAPGGVASTSFVAHAGAGGNSLVRLETGLTFDRPGRMSSLRIGDTIARGGVGAVPLRFAGIQYGRNFATQPGFITMPLPSLKGTAALPSTVDVYVNNALQATKQVQPGPFELRQVPVQSGGGDVRLVVRDMLGREVIATQPYYASRDLLRRHLLDFSYELGFIRRDFGVKSNSYGTLMAAVSERYGLTDAVTVEGHAEATRHVQQIGAAANLLVDRIGLLSAEAAVSHANGRTGTEISGTLEHRSAAFSLGLHVQRASRAYSFIGASPTLPPPRLAVEAFADVRIAGSVSVGANLAARSRYGAPDERVAGAYARLAAGRLGSVQLYARYGEAEKRSLAFGGSFAVVLGGHRSATASVETERGRPTAYASIQSDAPAGIGTGWRVSASAGEVDSLSGAYRVQTEASAFTFEAAQTGRQTGLRASAAGSLGFVDGRAFASRQLGNSFASVSVGGYQGVRIYADNQLVAKTGKSGRAIIPGLRAYEPNQIRIDEADLPIEAQLGASERIVRPFARAGVVLSFAPVAAGGFLLWVQDEDGRPVPAGASVMFNGREDRTVVAPGGMVYAPAASGPLELSIEWQGRTCRVTAAVPAGADPQPVLKGLVCRIATRVADAR